MCLLPLMSQPEVLTSLVSTWSSRSSLLKTQKPIFTDLVVLLVLVAAENASHFTRSNRKCLFRSLKTRQVSSSRKLVCPSPMMSSVLPSEIPSSHLKRSRIRSYLSLRTLQSNSSTMKMVTLNELFAKLWRCCQATIKKFY